MSGNRLIKQAEIEYGQLIVRQYEDDDHVRRREINVSVVFSPGTRAKNDMDILIIEARQQASGDEVDNPAFPDDVELAQRATKKIVEDLGLTPAYAEAAPVIIPTFERWRWRRRLIMERRWQPSTDKKTTSVSIDADLKHEVRQRE